jgi:RsiW-degrading membrane proteinase PrsW (M82 family)
MNGANRGGADHWYYLRGSETCGPLGTDEIVGLVRGGSLSGTTQVAQAGGQTWSSASIALAQWLGSPVRVAPAPEPPAYAIRIQCISGPDHGKAYMVSAPEVSLGRVSGLGQSDPNVAEVHVVLSWQNNSLHFRALPGSSVRVAGIEVIQGSLNNGQQFQLGASVWQVGNTPVELTNLLGSLGARLNRLTSTDKLQGFSLKVMFSEVFKKRSADELEEYFVTGTAKTTPPLLQVPTGWPQPWFFMRILLFLTVVYFALYAMLETYHNPLLVPGLMMMGSLAVPLATVFLFWEMNTPRNVSFHTVLMLVCLGGVISLFVSLIEYGFGTLDWLGASQAGIVEETGKLLAVILVVRSTRYRWILNGMVFGAAIGGGFAVFESAGYAFQKGYLDTFLNYLLNHADDAALNQVINSAQFAGYDSMLNLIHIRAALAPFGHMLWTAIAAGALWRVKGARPFRVSMLFDTSFLGTFLIPVALHMLWDSPVLEASISEVFVKGLALGAVGWYVAFTLIQQGLKQVREAQLTETQTELQQTQDILTTTGHFERQVL